MAARWLLRMGFVALMGLASVATARADMPDSELTTVDGQRRRLYDLLDLPSHLVVIGSGVTGAEFAGAYRALGSEVIGFVFAAFILLLAFGSALAMGLPLSQNNIQNVRAKLKRLASRGILIETHQNTSLLRQGDA